MTSTAERPLAGGAAAEAARRRTFAVISHPDAGKSTLTEALALHARVIQEAGAIHGKAGRKSTVSDWMDMEKARGISISSAALQFGYGDTVVNLVDTPGHADFSEDTYRVLAAVDSAVMLLDAAKGLEPQTMKLFDVCRHRGIPVLTVVNKWDRPGLEALQLMDEIRDRTGLEPTPLTWPVGIAGDFRGVLERSSGDFVRFTRTAGGATIAPEERVSPERALADEGDAWTTAVEEVELLDAMGQVHDQESFLAGQTTPVLRSSTPWKSPAMPTGQVSGVGSRPVRSRISSMSCRASRPGRSHLLTTVMTGMPRCRQTSNSFIVCGSRPLAASSSITALSTAASTR